ncbi:MAG: hypothetical protein P8X79_06505 [Reinekea sp.]
MIPLCFPKIGVNLWVHLQFFGVTDSGIPWTQRRYGVTDSGLKYR